MGMQQQPQQATHQTDFIIEATSHCRNGKLPRWSFLVQGVGGSLRHAMVGTDAQGHGLYLYASPTADLSARTLLIAPGELTLSDTLNRQQANDEVMKLLEAVNWNEIQLSPRPPAPRFELYAVT